MYNVYFYGRFDNMNRKTARDLAFKLLYQADIQKEDGDVVFDIAKEEYNIDEKSKEYIGNILYQ